MSIPIKAISPVLIATLFLALISTTACTAKGPDSAYQELLSAIPDTQGTRDGLFIDDYSLVREIFDVPALPGPGDDDSTLDALYEWRAPLAYELNADAPPVLAFGSASSFGPFRYRPPRESLRHLAFDARNMEQSVVAVSPRSIDVTLGNFDPKATGEALESCAECPPSARNQYEGISYFSWSEEADPNMAFALPAFDNVGRGGHIAVTDRIAARVQTDNDMKVLIDTMQGKRRSLADLEEFQLVANGMAQLRSYTMLLSSLTLSMDSLEGMVLENGRRPGQRLLDRWAKPVLLRPYLAYGTGAGIDDEGPYMALVLAHSNASDADENVALLQERIREGVRIVYDEPWSDDIEDASVTTDGLLLLAKLRGRIARSPMVWVLENENLILHE